MAVTFLNVAKVRNVGTNPTLPLTITATTAGSFLVLASSYDSVSSGTPTIAGGGTWAIVDGPFVNSNINVFSALCPVVTAGTTLVTISWHGGSNPTFSDVYVWEFANLTNPVIDKVKHATGVGAGSKSSGLTGTLGSTDEAAIGFGCDTTAISAAGAGWTDDGSVATGSWGEHKLLTANTSLDATFTAGSTWGILIATVMSGGAGTAPDPARPRRSPRIRAPQRGPYTGKAYREVPLPGPINSIAAVTLDDVTLASASTLAIQGTAAPTLDDVTLASTFSVTTPGETVRGRRAPRIGPKRGPFAGKAYIEVPTPPIAGAISGTAAITLDDVTLASTATLKLQAAAAPTLADVTLASASALKIQGTAAPTLGDVTLASAATLPVHATAAPTLDDVTLASAATLKLQAAAAITVADVVMSAADTLLIQAQAAINDAAVTLSSTATLKIQATSAITLDDVTLVGTSTIGAGISATAAITLDDVILTATSHNDTPVTATGGGGVGGGYFSRRRYDELMRLLAGLREKREEIAAKAPRKALAKAIHATESVLEVVDENDDRLTELLHAAAAARSTATIIEAANAAYTQAKEIRAQHQRLLEDEDDILALIL